MKTIRNPAIQYDYIVRRISNKKSSGYKAIIPAFGSIVFGDNLMELEEGISLAIKEEVRARKLARGNKGGIPVPDSTQTFSGKFIVRVHPALHERIALEAKVRGKSLNAYIQEKMAA